MPQRIHVILKLPGCDEGPFCRASVSFLLQLTQEKVFFCDAIGEVPQPQKAQIEIFLIATEKPLVFRSFYLSDRQNRQVCQVKRRLGRVFACCPLFIVVSHRPMNPPG